MEKTLNLLELNRKFNQNQITKIHNSRHREKDCIRNKSNQNNHKIQAMRI